MSTFQQQKQQVLQLFNAAVVTAKSIKDEDAERRLRESAKHLVDGKLYVVVAGEFKQGKSSLINALIETPGLFPVDVDITTNLVTSITYSERERYTVLVGEAGHEAERQISREEIADFVTEQKNPKNDRSARMLIIEQPNASLRDGMILVDTPGVGTLNIEHTDITYAYLPNADAVLFVSDALKPLTSEELSFVRDRIARHTQNVIFVVTKIDKNRDFETIIENNREKLAEVLERPAEDIPIVPVSSHLKLAYLEGKDEEDLEDSNYKALESALWNQLHQQRGQILVSKALVDLGQIVAQMKAPLAAELEACQTTTKEELDALERRFEDAKERLQVLIENDASWRTQLNRGLMQIRSDMAVQLQDAFVGVRRRATEALDDVKMLQNPQYLATCAEMDVNGMMAEISRTLAEQAGALQARVEASTGMDLNPFDCDLATNRVRAQSMQIEAKKDSWWSNALIIGKAGGFTATAGAFLGGLVGGVAGGAIGVLLGPAGVIGGAALGAKFGGMLGSIAGGATGLRDGLKQLKVKDKPAITKMLVQFLDDSQRICSKTLNDTIATLDHSMQDDLTGQLRREKKACEQTVKSIQETRKLTQEQMVKRAAELKTPLQQIGQLQTGAETVAKTIVQQAITVPKFERLANAAAAAITPTIPMTVPTPTPPAPAPPPAPPSTTPAPRKDFGDWADE